MLERGAADRGDVLKVGGVLWAVAVVTGREVDHVAGLLSLREGVPFALFAAPSILAALAANSVFDVLAPAHVPRMPLALGRGTGSELHRPLGITIVGGLIVSQALTLFTTPVVYVYLDRLRLALRGGEDKALPETSSPGTPRPSPAH